MKYCVTVVRTGCLFIKADSEEDALSIANRQLTDTVCWSDDWSATDACEDNSILDNYYITE